MCVYVRGPLAWWWHSIEAIAACFGCTTPAPPSQTIPEKLSAKLMLLRWVFPPLTPSRQPTWLSVMVSCERVCLYVYFHDRKIWFLEYKNMHHYCSTAPQIVWRWKTVFPAWVSFFVLPSLTLLARTGWLVTAQTEGVENVFIFREICCFILLVRLFAGSSTSSQGSSRPVQSCNLV